MIHEFLATPAAVSVSRRATVRALVEWGLTQAQTEDFALVVSELVTNAINVRKHHRFIVRICEEIVGTLTVEVWDSVSEPPRCKPQGLYAEGGRGLPIVQALAVHHGWRPAEEGKWVFAVLEVPPHG